MCDTMVALGNSTADGSVMFAKNSDRQPNEPHIMVRIPRQKYDTVSDKYLKATYIQIPQVGENFEVVLLKPSWIWGCEMGWNEYGLNIGNEAVFTREKQDKESLTGMDMARIALERCKTSEEAVDTITALLRLYGQGGNCGYEKAFTYHNSFLIADRNSAWVLETAGSYWAAKRVKDIYCISNCLTIEKEFDKCHPDLIKHAIEKGWCKKEDEFNFARCYGNHIYTCFSRAKERRRKCETILRQEQGRITIDVMKKILRSHEDRIEGRQFTRNSVGSVCMHGGGIIGDHTTGSYIASISDKVSTYWVTGASTPCISVFKPLWKGSDMPVFGEDNQKEAIEYWMLREKLHRMILSSQVDLERYIKERDSLEQEFYDIYNKIDINTADEKILSNISYNAFKKEKEFILKAIGDYNVLLSKQPPKGSLYFKYYWKKQNQGLIKDGLFFT